MRKIVAIAIMAIWSGYAFSEGSKNLTPSNTGTATGTNTFVGYLEHDVNAGGIDTRNFFDPQAPVDERVYVYIKNGETLYWGLGRLNFAAFGVTNEDLTVALFEFGDTPGTDAPVSTWLLSADNGTDDNSIFQDGSGVIHTYAEAAAGPLALVAGGYDANSYTNNTGVDQDFFIVFLQNNAGPNAGYTNDVDARSQYNLWDFSVFDGTQEKTGRLHGKKLSFSADGGTNLLSTEFQLFSLIPSTVGGVSAGYYVKELDLSGIAPYSLSVYSNSTGADAAQANTTDFRELRQSQGTEIALIEYDLFINNPDLEVYPTSTLPTVTITDANFYCNPLGTGGEAAITFESNQTGQIAVIVDLNGVNGYQDGTTDVILEAEVAAEGYSVVRWNGLDGLGATVASGTAITITGRFTSGPLHVPLFDVEDNTAGIRMLDVRPATSFDLIFWDDTNVTTNQTPTVELDGSNTNNHNWTGTNADLHNTWSFGYYQVNTQSVNFDYVCDDDGDGVLGTSDGDSDNDGLSDSQEGDWDFDSDGDGILDYVDTDFAGFVDSNADGVNDNFDFDQDGIPNALDLDSDNDGITDAIESGQSDADNNGTVDGFTDTSGGQGAFVSYTLSSGCTTGMQVITDETIVTLADDETIAIQIPFEFYFFNTKYASGSSMYLNSNGWVSFDDIDQGGLNDYTAVSFPNATFTNTIAFNHNDHNPNNGAGGTISYGVSGTSPNRTFIIYYNTVLFFGGGGSSTTQVQIYESNDEIRIVTDNFNPGSGNTKTMGLNVDGTTSSTVAGRNLANYTITTAECQSWVPSYGTGPNGIDDTIDGAAISPTSTNDGDTQANYLDFDSDNDGIVDAIEAGGSAGTNGQIASFADTNGNGWNDTQEVGALPLTDTDADGTLPNYLDFDSDNDGIDDNVEAQASNSYIAIVAGDTDSNGLLDVYDPNNGGTLITPVNTDSNGGADYIDLDSDGDGIIDLIEGHDADFDGFGDWDANTDHVLDATDFAGFNSDGDGDGIWNVFDPDNSGTAATVPNSDGAGLSNWQDTDDDNDGKLSAGEDVGGNGVWSDDFTEGQGSGTPDYLYRGDFDGDAIADATDADSDNDGITDATEDNGEAIDPSGDEDGDSVPNYRDASDATVTGGLTSTADINSDGVYDVFDSDLDGTPDFLDLDSDNDGVLDAVEANNGSVPFGLNVTTGMFGLQDPDNDGLMNYVDSDAVAAGGTSTLANADSDADGVNDYRDIDSDRDGIVDIIEFQTTAAYIAASGTDSDGDGIDDSFDPNAGGTLLSPVNSDGADLPDYLDTDSDNDGVLDIIEGDDTNFDGFGDWDVLTQDNDITNETGYGTDTDGDGLDNIFDNVVLGSGDNTLGSNTDLQNTDGTDFRDWRDSNDDNDTATTAAEDFNTNGDWTDDKTNGQGMASTIPDYLFNGDTDGDGVFDLSDLDSDNDGIFDIDEDKGETINPSGDEDGDGIPNFRDFTDATVTAGLSSTADTNADGVYDVFDSDLDGLADFKDLDSDNDGIPDIIEAGGVDADGNGQVDNITDTDGDGLSDVFDTDNGGTLLIIEDVDGDGLIDAADLDADNDGLPDIIEAGGTDSDNDGKVDNTTDTDADGLVDLIDSDQGGTAYTIPDSDNDGREDYKDLDSDNDGITDAVENRLGDTDGDGYVDNATDTDGDGWPNAADPDNGGTPATSVDDDNDGVMNHQDLDADNDGLPDIIEAGGTDANGDGVVDNALDADNDGIPDNVDITYTGGTDSDADGIENTFDVDQTGGNDTDGDSIDNTFDSDADGDGFDDFVEANPYLNADTDGDGNPDSHDLDSDNDGITNPYEYGQTVDGATGQLSGFTDANGNGWNDTQESTPITPPNSDSDPFSLADYKDLDSDDDGIPDNFEAQTKATYIAPSGIDTDGDGLDDAYDPNNGGTLITPVNTDATGNDDFLDADSDGDGINDNVEGANGDRNQFGDWDSNTNNLATDETGWDADVDEDGIFDLFDSSNGSGSANITGSSSAVQDTDIDNIWDFQDTDDDGDGTLTSAEATTPVLDPGGIIPDYLYGNQDTDGDTVNDGVDLDSDNDGLADSREDGGTGIDPSGDVDSDGIMNFRDPDIDGDGTLNGADTDGDGSGTNTTAFVDTNSDSVIDQFDKDLDGIADFRDLDSDNDGITDILELALSDGNQDGTLNEGSGITDLNGNGIDDNYDATCTPCGGVTGTAVTILDTDSDGVDNHHDLDSDNDGITDNREAQTTAAYIAPASGDTDTDGILDVYDANNGGTGITPTNFDGTGSADYLDTDSDDDGVLDNIEGWDADGNGFADWDAVGSNNDITDETGYNVDSDNDGIWNIFDNSSGLGTIANIDGSGQVLQNTDGDSETDLRDLDDDGDGSNTSTTGASGEDANSNGNWTDDFTQGGGSVPNYLYNPDVDNDSVTDATDADSDNDGILNTDEYAGAVYFASGTPFDDADGDGIYNYLDTNDVNNGSFADANGDGVDDQVDQDRDGIPNFFDLDSDNDGLLDAVEANDGAVPAIGGFAINTGRFSGTDTTPNDGLVDAVAAAPLAKGNLDADGLDDYLDLDSDNDGLTDNIEAQTTAALSAPSGTDTDGDGVDDNYDNDNGGTPLTPINTDGTDEPDYRDTNSDNDLSNSLFIADFIEGFDANRNGFSDLDLDQDGLLSDQVGYNTDTDGDGLWDLYDNFSGRGLNNILGSNADLQDTDGDGTLDFRDVDDDEDNITTTLEDVDGDGIWTNDKVQGGGATPDYLFFNDSDKDLIADGLDQDGDQDGVLNNDEYTATAIDPFADADLDGLYNYNDLDNPGALTDSNADGIWDEYDTDLDGVPNFFDLDSDNDGIPDLIENGGTDADGDGKLDGLADADNDGLLDTYDVDATMGVDSDGDGIDDAFDRSVVGSGVDFDGDDVLDTVDRDDNGDGIIDTVDSSTDESSPGTPLTIGDFDGDGVANMFDRDSDNDGIVDLIEGGGSDFDGDGELDAFGDTDGDGFGNAVDADNGGTALTMPNTDSADESDYLDFDADGDGTFDYLEGFDDDEDDASQDDYEARAIAYGNATHYNQLDMVWFTNDADADNWPDFLDPDVTTRYVDSDGDGIVNLFDVDQGGNFYGNVSGKPDNDTDGKENYVDKNGDFTVSRSFLTTGEDGSFDTFDVALTLMPVTDVVIDIAITNAADEVSLDLTSLTFNSGNWNVPRTVTVTGQNDALFDGDESFEITVSVNDASSDDDYDDALNQTIDGTNEDNEGSIRVSTNTVTSAEGGSNVTFSVELSVAPATNVVINVDDGSSDEGNVSPATLTFTSGDWDTPQDVTISPQDDALLDGDQGYTITLSVDDPSSDDAFDPAGDELIAVTNQDDEQGVVLSTTSVTTAEIGTTGNFTIVLDVTPASDVNLTIAESSDEGSVSPTNITFNSGNWNVARVITVTPADDVDSDGDQIYAVTVSVDGGSDPSFTSLAAQTVNVTNVDDETGPLPLDFLSFSGQFDNEDVLLNWVTTNEINVSHFEIEHSLDGSSFLAIGNVEAVNVVASVNDYSYTHDSPTAAVNYYRIKEVDLDGLFEYSNIIMMESPYYRLEFNHYPNPVEDILRIGTSKRLSRAFIRVVSVTGSIVYQNMLPSLNDDHFEIDLSNVQLGVYQVLIETDLGTKQFRILKK